VPGDIGVVFAEVQSVDGQWLGTIHGTNEGTLLLNIDADRPNLGWLQVDDAQQPFSVFVRFTVNAPDVTGQLENFIVYGAPQPGITLPGIGQITGTLNENTVVGNWQTDMDTNGTFELTRSENLEVRPADRTVEWREFRQWILDDSENLTSTVFRGHRKAAYPLNTTFHRSGRRNLTRYTYEDVPALCRHVEATLDTRYNLDDANDFGGLLYLAQHHGYPTPLLDWTRSPFVAAYFALGNATEQAEDEQPARVFLFNLAGWPHVRVNTIAELRPMFAPLSLRATHNPRALPQQSIPMFSNIVDIEGFVVREEQRLQRRFLQRVDIPASERRIAMRELNAMGVTAASLFPGLDGLCRALAARWFVAT
jgi:FRG domain